MSSENEALAEFPKTYGDWGVFTLGKLLHPVVTNMGTARRAGKVTQRKDAVFVRKLRLSTEQFNPKRMTELRDSKTALFGIGVFNDIDNANIPSIMLEEGKKTFINTFMDAFATAKRESRSLLGDSAKNNVSLYDTISAEAAYLLMKFGYIQINGEVFRLRKNDVSWLQSGGTFEEYALFVMAKREEEFIEWIPVLDRMHSNEEIDYSLESLQKLLSNEVKAEDAETFMSVIPVWLDDILAL